LDGDDDDATLVEAARRGEVRALERLLDRHEGAVLRTLRYLGVPLQDREDVAQEIFIRVFRHLRGFRRGQEFGGWLYRITVNAAHDYGSRRGRTSLTESPWSEEGEGEEQHRGPRPELRVELERALEALGERERTIFVLREIEGLDTRDVARALGITSITVRRHLSRARRHLRDLLSGEGEKKESLGVERIVPGGSRHG
jgi:RNA polymerase sigma-70 factor (ECF subfamily)